MSDIITVTAGTFNGFGNDIVGVHKKAQQRSKAMFLENPGYYDEVGDEVLFCKTGVKIWHLCTRNHSGINIGSWRELHLKKQIFGDPDSPSVDMVRELSGLLSSYRATCKSLLYVEADSLIEATWWGNYKKLHHEIFVGAGGIVHYDDGSISKPSTKGGSAQITYLERWEDDLRCQEVKLFREGDDKSFMKITPTKHGWEVEIYYSA